MGLRPMLMTISRRAQSLGLISLYQLRSSSRLDFDRKGARTHSYLLWQKFEVGSTGSTSSTSLSESVLAKSLRNFSQDLAPSYSLCDSQTLRPSLILLHTIYAAKLQSPYSANDIPTIRSATYGRISSASATPNFHA